MVTEITVLTHGKRLIPIGEDESDYDLDATCAAYSRVAAEELSRRLPGIRVKVIVQRDAYPSAVEGDETVTDLDQAGPEIVAAAEEVQEAADKRYKEWLIRKDGTIPQNPYEDQGE